MTNTPDDVLTPLATTHTGTTSPEGSSFALKCYLGINVRVASIQDSGSWLSQGCQLLQPTWTNTSHN
jgi:hypothetical protein